MVVFEGVRVSIEITSDFIVLGALNAHQFAHTLMWVTFVLILLEELRIWISNSVFLMRLKFKIVFINNILSQLWTLSKRTSFRVDLLDWFAILLCLVIVFMVCICCNLIERSCIVYIFIKNLNDLIFINGYLRIHWIWVLSQQNLWRWDEETSFFLLNWYS